MSDSTLTRSERIRILLENYVDVEAGLRDRRGNGDHVPLMSACWNHPSYRQLDQLLGLLKDSQRNLYWHLSQTYFHAFTRRVLVCQHPRCEVTYPSWVNISFHSHGRRPVAVVPRAVRQVHPSVRGERVVEAIEWLEAGWLGDVFLPDELVHLAA